jgi:hypothetical protein
MPSREESAAANLRQAIRDANGDFVVEWIEPAVDGYFLLFRSRQALHSEPRIDEAVLEDGPATEAMRALVHKVKAVFGQT